MTRREPEVGGAVEILGEWRVVRKVNARSVRLAPPKRGGWSPKACRSLITGFRSAAEVRVILGGIS